MRISPRTFCRLLTSAWNDNGIREDFVSSMVANGGEGTLKKRMNRPGLTVRGKTGTLNDVIGFAGYVSGPSGKTYAAAIMLNEVRDRFKARQAVDSLLEQVAFSACDTCSISLRTPVGEALCPPEAPKFECNHTSKHQVFFHSVLSPQSSALSPVLWPSRSTEESRDVRLDFSLFYIVLADIQ